MRREGGFKQEVDVRDQSGLCHCCLSVNKKKSPCPKSHQEEQFFAFFCNDVPTTAVLPGEKVAPNSIEKPCNLIIFTKRKGASTLGWVSYFSSGSLGTFGTSCWHEVRVFPLISHLCKESPLPSPGRQ